MSTYGLARRYFFNPHRPIVLVCTVWYNIKLSSVFSDFTLLVVLTKITNMSSSTFKFAIYAKAIDYQALYYLG